MQTIFGDESVALVFLLAFVAVARAAWCAWRERRFTFAYAYLVPLGGFFIVYFYLSIVPGFTTAPVELLALIVRPLLCLIAILLAMQFNRDWITAKWAQRIAPAAMGLKLKLILWRKKLQ